MVAAGVDIRTAQERLGHSDPRLTLTVYAHLRSMAISRPPHGLENISCPRGARPTARPRADRGIRLGTSLNRPSPSLR
jgi:hypothetical protein